MASVGSPEGQRASIDSFYSALQDEVFHRLETERKEKEAREAALVRLFGGIQGGFIRDLKGI